MTVAFSILIYPSFAIPPILPQTNFLPASAWLRCRSRLGSLDCLSLEQNQLRDAFLSQLQQSIHLFARERRAFRRALHFNEPPIAGAYDIHVHFGARVFVIFQIEQSPAIHDTHTNSRNFAD